MDKTSKALQQIRERNARVEADKAWETSLARRGIIAVFTYFVVVLFLFLIGAPRPWFNAFIPALAYLLSTMSLPFLKRLWVKKLYRK
jgi:hypothetical protein